MDTIDFASDSALVALARARLDNIRALKALHSLQPKWISGGVSLGLGYDTNVISLPAEVSPADYGLSDEADTLNTNLAFLSLSPPWSRFFTHKLNYNFLMTRHLNKDIGSVYDSHVHDLGTQVGFRSSSWTGHTLAYSWSSISLGPLGSSEETLRTHTASYTLKTAFGKDPQRISSEWDLGFKFGLIQPLREATSAENDLTASSYQIFWKIQRRRDFPHLYGPEFSVEFRPSKGRENTLWDFKGAFHWSYYFGSSSTPWYLQQSASFSYKPYYLSARERHDYTPSYVGSLGRTWNSHLDTRLQVQGTMNFSTVKSLYQYRQAAVSLLVTAFF